MTNTTPERVNILNEAAGLITGQRQQDYGTPEENFQRIADFANIIFKKNLETNTPISPRQTADFMILLKVARTINSPTRDSYVDIGGYAGIAGELASLEDKKTSTLTGAKIVVNGVPLLDKNRLDSALNTAALNGAL